MKLVLGQGTIIHPFIIYNCLSLEGCGGLESILADTGREAGYILESLPVNERSDTQRQTTIHAHSRTYWQFRVTI